MKVRRGTILLTVVVLFLAVTMAIFAVAPTLSSMAYTPQTVSYGTFGFVTVQFPSNATHPAPAGTPNHPTDLKFQVYDGNRQATFGQTDSIFVFIWNPSNEQFAPVAVITDNGYNAALQKTIWNMTYVWYPISQTVNPFPNIILVAQNELEVMTSDGVLTVNLTKPITVTLPIFGSYGNQTFVLPPLTMEFRGIGESFQDYVNLTFRGYAGASNYTMAGYLMSQPAWVSVKIPDWCAKGGTQSLEFIGHISSGGIYAVPP